MFIIYFKIRKTTTIAVFLGISKAFDTIDHNILFAKLYIIVELLSLWNLRNCLGVFHEIVDEFVLTQFVIHVYGDMKSQLRDVTCGVL